MDKAIFKKVFPGLIVSWSFILLISLSGCQKIEGNYYHYQNPNSVYNGSTYQFLESQKGLYDSLLYVIDRVGGLKDSLNKTDDSFTSTLFVASNKSFQTALENLNVFRALQSKPPLYLHQLDSVQLDTLLRRYVFAEQIITDSVSMLSDGKLFESVAISDSLGSKYNMHLKYERHNASGYTKGGPQTIIFSDPKNSQFERYWVKSVTSSVNIATKTGYVHLLESGHEFGFGEFMERMNK